MFKAAVFASSLLFASEVMAQDHWPHQGPRFQSVRWDFECTATFKVRSVRLVVEKSEKGTRYAVTLRSVLVNERPIAEKDMIVFRRVLDKFSSLPQALILCSEEGASLSIGPHYRRVDFKNGKFIRAPHAVDVLQIRADGVSEAGQIAISE